MISVEWSPRRHPTYKKLIKRVLVCTARVREIACRTIILGCRNRGKDRDFTLWPLIIVHVMCSCKSANRNNGWAALEYWRKTFHRQLAFTKWNRCWIDARQILTMFGAATISAKDSCQPYPSSYCWCGTLVSYSYTCYYQLHINCRLEWAMETKFREIVHQWERSPYKCDLNLYVGICSIFSQKAMLQVTMAGRLLTKVPGGLNY